MQLAKIIKRRQLDDI
jgi:hypothetical protein